VEKHPKGLLQTEQSFVRSRRPHLFFNYLLLRSKLSLVVALLDRVLEVSIATLYFSLQVLFRGTETTTVATIHCYFNAFSFISRLTCLTLFSSWINEESQEPIRILNSVPPNEYSAEVRLDFQIFVIH
jgi:hypothetical protein